MSCDWDVYCVDCKEGCGISDANHCMKLMLKLISHADALSTLGPLYAELYELQFIAEGNHVDLSFFAKHKDHQLRARSEYGEYSDPCGTEFVCQICNAIVKCDRLEHGNSYDPNRHNHQVDQPENSVVPTYHYSTT